MLRIRGFSSNLYGWWERYRLDGREVELAEVLRDCAAAGLDAVEIDPTPEAREHLAQAGLCVSGAYVGVPLHQPWAELQAEAKILSVARRLAAAGGADLLVNADPKGGWGSPLPKTEDELKQQGENLRRLAASVAPLGVRVLFHNHAAARERTEADLRSVVEFSAPEVGLCIDTGWAHTSHCDPIAWVRTFPKRVFGFHLRNQRGSVPTEDLIEGDLDFSALLRALGEIGYDGWLALELWHRSDTHARRTMIEDVRRSIGYLREASERVRQEAG